MTKIFKVNKYMFESLFKQTSNSQSTTFLASKFTINKSYSTEASGGEDAENKPDEPKERVFFKEQEVIDGFKVFDPYMNKKRASFDQRSRRTYKKQDRDPFARYNRMSTDQDWTNVWPTASIFKQSAVPLPVRQGYIKNLSENEGLAPEKYGNVELMKIPNFLHLTPPHIKKHCAALKKFCTEWPKEIEDAKECDKFFPLEITTSNYIYDSPSIRDDRARIVKLQFKLSSLGLNERATDKLIKLVGERYDKQNDLVTIVADRCPYRNQNEDYAMYLLTTLYYESQQIEEWENEITESDRPRAIWSLSQSKENISNLISKIDKNLNINDNIKVKEYEKSFQKVFNEGETEKNLDDYKKSVLNLLKINKQPVSSTK